jgi:hypothetical protein
MTTTKSKSGSTLEAKVDPKNFLEYARSRLQVSTHEAPDGAILRKYYIISDGIGSVFMSEIIVDGISDIRYETDHDRLLAFQWLTKGRAFKPMSIKAEIPLRPSRINQEDEGYFK